MKGVTYVKKVKCIETGDVWCALRPDDDPESLESIMSLCSIVAFTGLHRVVEVRQPTCQFCAKKVTLELGMLVVWSQAKRRGDTIEVEKCVGEIDEFIGEAAMVRRDGFRNRKQLPCRDLTPRALDTPLSIMQAAARAVRKGV